MVVIPQAAPEETAELIVQWMELVEGMIRVEQPWTIQLRVTVQPEGQRPAIQPLVDPVILQRMGPPPEVLHHPRALAADPMAGKPIYERHCESCHGLKGRGRLAGTPDFRRGDALLKSDIALVAHIRAGRGGDFDAPLAV